MEKKEEKKPGTTISDIMEKMLDEVNGSIKKDKDEGNTKKFEISKYLGKGGFGSLFELTYDKRKYAGKLIKQEGGQGKKENEVEVIKGFRGQNIVKIIYAPETTYANDKYYLIIMEMAKNEDLGKFIFNLKNNRLGLIINSQNKFIGENLLRFLIFQLIKGLGILYSNNYCHFDIKPANVLICDNVIPKWSDFGLLRDIETIKDNNKKDPLISIPGGTLGYFSPEYFKNAGKLYLTQAFQHDYFGLGASIYSIIYGKKMLDDNWLNYNEKDSKLTANTIIEIIERRIDEIKSDKTLDKDFIDFLCSLIQYIPEERPDYQKLFSNSWLYKNEGEIQNIFYINENENDDDKLVIELKKSDFLIERKDFRKNRNDKKEEKKVPKKRFIFKKNKMI